MVEDIAAQDPDFVLIPGDLVMDDAGDPKRWDKFFNIFAPLYKRSNRLLYPIPGNHDFAGDSDAAKRIWWERWDLPEPRFFYSFQRGPVYVAGLSVTGESSLCGRWLLPPEMHDAYISQIEWLRRDLDGLPSAIRWKFNSTMNPRRTTPIYGGASQMSPRLWSPWRLRPTSI